MRQSGRRLDERKCWYCLACETWLDMGEMAFCEVYREGYDRGWNEAMALGRRLGWEEALAEQRETAIRDEVKRLQTEVGEDE